MFVWGWTAAALADTCSSYAAPEVMGEVSGSSVVEASGLAAARTREGVFFTHGDKGNPSVLVAFDADGTLLDEHVVVDATNEDWEDLAAAPCPDEGDCLYVGDIGDNDAVRASITVYVVREPEAGDDKIKTIARYTAVYPDGPHDAEALLMQPCTGRLHVVTKDTDGLSTIYRFPVAPEDTVTLEEVAKVQIDGPTAESREVTGGAWDQDGDRLVLRTSDRVFHWVTDAAQPNGHWQDPPLVIVGANAVQGEGITFGLDGDLYGTSEGDPIPLDRYACDALADAEGVCVFPQTGRSCGCAAGPGAGGVLVVLLALPFARRRSLTAGR